MEPGKAAYLKNRSIAYMQIESWNEALKDLNVLIEKAPSNGDAFYNRSKVHLQLNNSGQACQDMRQSAKLGFEQAFAYVAGLCDN